MLRVHREGEDGFEAALARTCDRGEADHTRVEPVVRAILAAVRAEGDEAVRRYGMELDKRRVETLFVRDFNGAEALARLPSEARAALELGADRIASYHEHQRDAGFLFEEDGVTLGLRVRPVERAGVYAPGGKARYPSSVLMSAIPARVAGVREIILATPLHGTNDDPVLAAAHLAGVTGLVDAGGAQAIAALAYGTQSIPRVDVLVGPGNAYVACAKRLVYGAVQIDGVAGPSEILVVADESATPAWVAADMLSQAEHDEDAYSLLVTSSETLAREVVREVEAQLASLPRKAIAQTAIERNGGVFVVAEGAIPAIADRIAAEHLALHVRNPSEMLEKIGSAGAAFCGHLTPEAAGDYVAGPSHVLPTGGSVRFGSPLGVYSFLKRTSILGYSEGALRAQASAITALARLEGLDGHARAIEARLSKR